MLFGSWWEISENGDRGFTQNFDARLVSIVVCPGEPFSEKCLFWTKFQDSHVHFSGNKFPKWILFQMLQSERSMWMQAYIYTYAYAYTYAYTYTNTYTLHGPRPGRPAVRRSRGRPSGAHVRYMYLHLYNITHMYTQYYIFVLTCLRPWLLEMGWDEMGWIHGSSETCFPMFSTPQPLKPTRFFKIDII